MKATPKVWEILLFVAVTLFVLFYYVRTHNSHPRVDLLPNPPQYMEKPDIINVFCSNQDGIKWPARISRDGRWMCVQSDKDSWKGIIVDDGVPCDRKEPKRN